MAGTQLIPSSNGRGGLIVHKDNPFQVDVQKMMDRMKTALRSGSGEGYQGVKFTLTMEAQYFPGRYTKVYQNKELCRLTPYACKLFIYIACNLDYEAQQVTIPYREVGMDRRTMGRALLELMDYRIIAKVERKKALYWVNVTLLVVGNLAKTENQPNG